MFLGSCADVAAAYSETGDDIWADILVGEQGALERLHAVILNSQVCSPLSASAAY